MAISFFCVCVWSVGGRQVQSVLGLELLECLYWRRGALLYMYCHTLHQRKQWIKKNKDTFLKVHHMTGPGCFLTYSASFGMKCYKCKAMCSG